MTPASENPLNDVLALAQERERYENWLATLNARRSAVAANVYDRVKADYEARLSAVVQQLAGHTAAIEQRRTEIAGDLGKIDAEERSARDAREEAELRAAVGEFTPDQWEKVRSESDASIAAIVSRRDGVKSELSRVETLRSQVTAPARPPAAAPAAAPAAPPPLAAAHSAPAPAPQPVATAHAAAPPPTLVSHRPTPQPESVAARPTPAPQPAAHVAPPAAPVAPQAKEEEGGRARPAHTPGGGRFDELAFIKSVVASTPPTEPEPASPPRPAAAQPAASEVRAPGERKSGQTAGPAPQAPAPRQSEGGIIKQTDQSAPLARVSSGTTLTKTLKCAECGTMNYPTEWYCERCGGELAAL